MGSIINVSSLDLTEVKLIEVRTSADERGSNTKVFSDDDLKSVGISFIPLEILSIHSNRNVLRGLHYQKCHGQGRIISCLKGELFLGIVDLNPYSHQFGKSCAYNLKKSNEYVYIPPDYALGTLAIKDSDFLCLCSDNPFMPEYASGVKWDDTDLGIEWPLGTESIITSRGDGKLPSYNDTMKELK
ncbi:dTDP-4-dehydrorhamnose 3,5-epimerase family protein [Anaerovibrio sp.]|uniref:dTDP-4-dehydrorhamnose 3,5-epimerase family protein n=1 Tax=Anaerovibrio sp. TaxID=1872532 RepID=UPI00388D91DC